MNSFGHIFSQSSQKNDFFLSLSLSIFPFAAKWNFITLTLNYFLSLVVVLSERVRKKNDVHRMCVCVDVCIY